MTVVDAWMRPPGPGDTRTAAQRRADALVDIARNVLNRGDAPTVGGVRPHLGILITPAALLGPGLSSLPTTTHAHRDPTDSGRTRPTTPADPASYGTDPAGSGIDPASSAQTRPALAWTRPARHRPGQSVPAGAGTAIGSGRFGSRGQPGDHRLTAGRHPTTARSSRGCNGSATSPPNSPNASPATATSGASSSTPPPDCPSTWAAPTASCPTGSAKPSTPATAPAAGPAATSPPHGPTPTTPNCPGTTAARPTSTNSCPLCRYHHVLAHEGRWTIRLDHTTGEVHVTRPDGTPYELGPSQPYRPIPHNPNHNPHRTHPASKPGGAHQAGRGNGETLDDLPGAA